MDIRRRNWSRIQHDDGQGVFPFSLRICSSDHTLTYTLARSLTHLLTHLNNIIKHWTHTLVHTHTHTHTNRYARNYSPSKKQNPGNQMNETDRDELDDVVNALSAEHCTQIPSYHQLSLYTQSFNCDTFYYLCPTCSVQVLSNFIGVISISVLLLFPRILILFHLIQSHMCMGDSFLLAHRWYHFGCF